MGTENGIESGDEQKLEHQPGRDMASDKDQWGRDEKEDSIQAAQNWPLCEPALPGVEEVAWPGCFQEFPSIPSAPLALCACQLSLPVGVGLQVSSSCGISRGGIWLLNKFH